MPAIALSGVRTARKRSGSLRAGPIESLPSRPRSGQSLCAERPLTMVATYRQQGRHLLALLMDASKAVLQRITAPSLLPA
jgi:hypothetical protein